jgi:thioredoxin 1
MAPILEEFAAHHPSIAVSKVDVEANHMIGLKFNITSIPTLILFVNGEEVKRISGVQSLPALESELEPWITIN